MILQGSTVGLSPWIYKGIENPGAAAVGERDISVLYQDGYIFQISRTSLCTLIH